MFNAKALLFSIGLGSATFCLGALVYRLMGPPDTAEGVAWGLGTVGALGFALGVAQTLVLLRVLKTDRREP